jgi:dihydroxyacid dehydratase/phosphogluconate dehydratase
MSCDTLASSQRKIFMATKHKTKFLTVRLEPPVHKAFHRKATEYGGVSEVLRELTTAFVEDRVTVTPNPERKTIYHVTRSQN